MTAIDWSLTAYMINASQRPKYERRSGTDLSANQHEAKAADVGMTLGRANDQSSTLHPAKARAAASEMLEAWSGDSVAAYRVRPRRLTEMSEAIMRTGHRMSVSEHGRNEKHRTLSLSCGRRRVLYRHAGARNEMRSSSHDARLMRH